MFGASDYMPVLEGNGTVYRYEVCGSHAIVVFVEVKFY